MKKHYVYQIVDLEGNIVYIGYSTNPKNRFRQHTAVPAEPGYGHGRFFGRQNELTLEIVKDFDTRSEACAYEGAYKIANGFEWTEKLSQIKAGKANRTMSFQDAEHIRRLYATGTMTQSQIGKMYNVTAVTISNIVNFKLYVEE